jgi:phage terminase small subunit
MSTPKPLSHLPIKHQLFVLHYPQCDHNATQAAIAAGYSPKTAGIQGHQLLKKLQGYIKPLQQQLIQRVQMSAEEVVDRLGQIARSDIRDVITWDTTAGSVTLKASDELSPEAAYAISEIYTVTTKWGTDIRVKMHDKAIALVSLGRYHNLFKRTTASKGLVVMFGAIKPGNQQEVQQLNDGARKLLPAKAREVSVSFQALPAAGTAPKKGKP